MPRLVRRTPLSERLRAMLNPMDFMLWLSEEFETRDWNSKSVGMQLGISINFAFLLARANSGGSREADPVFDDGATSGWFTALVSSIVWFLIFVSTANAFHTFTKTRKYRLFEADLDRKPQTPSAQRVRVQSSPAASSPMRFLSDIMSSESAESRAHPDKTRDVWEVSVWDPMPINLQIFCFFSPGHFLVYMLYLPVAHLDASPSVTVFKCLVLQIIITVQLLFLQSNFSQQNRDTAIIQKEVMHEYDTKFVHPRLYPTVRDVSTQLAIDEHSGCGTESVHVGTPTVQLKRSFKTRPNPNYIKHVDPENSMGARMTSTATGPNPVAHDVHTPPIAAARQSDASVFSSSGFKGRSSALRRSTPGMASPMNPKVARAVSGTAGTSGYLGAYDHPNSPLRKAPSMGDLPNRTPRNNSEMAQLEQYQAQRQADRSSSPIKGGRRSTGTAPGPNPQANNNPWWSQQTPRDPSERYPKMWGRGG